MMGASYLCPLHPPPPQGTHPYTHIHSTPRDPPPIPTHKPTSDLEGVSLCRREGQQGEDVHGCVHVHVCVCVRVEQGVERTHLPRYYCQSIIQGNARRAPRGCVHYALTTGSVLVSQPPRVIVCLRLRECVYIYACVCFYHNSMHPVHVCVCGVGWYTHRHWTLGCRCETL